MAFTEEQLRAIEAQGKVIVSASAGSGKTTVMIEKIIRLIQSGVNVDEILAVTFTKKAASQMKEKLCKALVNSINAPNTSAERRAALKKQLAEVPSADISTIHSFCAKLIRSHFFVAEVDNAFRVIGGDDAEGTALKNEALDELLEEGYEKKEEKFSHLLSVYWRKKSDNGLRRIFTSTYEELRNRADYRKYLQQSKGYSEETFDSICKDLHAKFLEKCKYYYELVEDEFAYFSDLDAAPQLALCSELMTWLEELQATKDYFLAQKVEKPKFTAKKSSKKDSEEKRLHIERLAFLKERIVKAYDGEFAKLLSRETELAHFLQSGETAAALAEYLLKFDEKYEALKLEKGVLDYNDLEHKALALLQKPEVAEEVRKKYRYVFVDEYQDVNPVQEAIIASLSSGQLFLVGDVKQAIYGFRGSKSRFFVEKQKAFENGEGQSLMMTRNFRSSDQVLDAVNAQFSLAMTPRVCDVDYARGSYMEKGGRYEVNSGKVQIHFVEKDEKEESTARGVYSVKANAKKREAKVSNIAKQIRYIIEQERNSKWYDPDKGEWRRVEYADIAILSRKKQGQIAATVAALAAEGVPVTSASAVNVCEFAEVKTLIDILSLLDNRQQDVPLCSALLSTMGNLTADDLAQIRLCYSEEDFFRNACKRYADEKEDVIAYKLQKFYAYYEELRLLSQVLNTAELLTKILSDTRMEAALLSRENGVACLKRIHRFIEEAGTESLCVHEFLSRLRDLDYEIEYMENGGEDSVKVLTMHSSKGLEYPVVILDNLNAPFRGTDHDEVFVEERYGLAPRAFDSGKMLKQATVLRKLHEVKEGESSRADELNLYYVALTRAKHTLHMVFSERAAMPDVKYAKSFAEFTDFSVWEQYVTDEKEIELEKQERTALAYHPDESLAREIMQAFQWEYDYADCTDLPVKSSATKLMGKAEFVTHEQANTFGKEEENGLFDETETQTLKGLDKDMGTAYHRFLEEFDFALLYDEQGERIGMESLRECIEVTLNRLSSLNVDCGLLVLEKLVEILSNPVFYTLRDARLYKEQQFLASLSMGETYGKQAELSERVQDEEVLFQGAIDLLAVGERNVRIIDYKYSSRSAEGLRAHYKPQLDLYKSAVAKILKIEPKHIHCSIVNIKRGFQVDMD